MNQREALRAVMLFGVVSLLGDVIYEGARGVVPDYLKYLGASAVVVGVVGGLGEFLGYSFRLVGGYLADTTRAYWAFVFLGYGLLVSIPLLALTLDWRIAVLLVLLERIAKGLRSPARDTLLSAVGRGLGTGKAFGLHELLDQVGAMAGPGILAVALYLSGNEYRYAFALLAVPYAILMAVLIYTYLELRIAVTRGFREEAGRSAGGMGRGFILYSLAVLLNTAGLIQVMVLLYRFSDYVAAWAVSLLYLLAMGVDAVVAPLAGSAYDALGRRVLYASFLLSPLPSILALIGGKVVVAAAGILLGVVLGMQESVYRAAVADLTGIEKRGAAYGVFNTFYGVGFLASGLAYGYFMDRGCIAVGIAYTLVLQLTALLLLRESIRETG